MCRTFHVIDTTSQVGHKLNCHVRICTSTFVISMTFAYIIQFCQPTPASHTWYNCKSCVELAYAQPTLSSTCVAHTHIKFLRLLQINTDRNSQKMKDHDFAHQSRTIDQQQCQYFNDHWTLSLTFAFQLCNNYMRCATVTFLPETLKSNGSNHNLQIVQPPRL